MEQHPATVWEAIADVVADGTAVVQGDRRLAWSQFDQRAARLAGALAEAGIGPGSKVALYLYNSPEYLEGFFAALKIRAVPINVNYRYLDEELLYLLDNSDAEALVFHASLGERVARILDRAKSLRLVLEVDDAAGVVEGVGEYEEAIAGAQPASRVTRSPDEIMMTYTGGTTGLPKGVMSKLGGAINTLLLTVPPLVGAAPLSDPADIPALARQLNDEGRAIRSLPACPLMHGTGIAIGAIPALTYGGTVVLLAERHFDPAALWRTVEREGVGWIVVVGDPFARPLLRTLDDMAASGAAPDLGSVRLIASAGAMFSSEIKQGLLDKIPQAMVIDYIAATEGLMGVSIATAGNVPPTGRFTPVPGVKVFAEDGSEVLPGSGVDGVVALAGGVPEGYYKDEAKSAATFRDVEGVRYSFPGDWAVVEADGSLTLKGRGSQCINTGGEKVFPEEVEEILKTHEAVEDALVFGLDDERFGQRVAAVASLRPGTDASANEVLVAARERLAAYKVPKEIRFVDTVPRSPSGKADYVAARELWG
jgi:fatty-acyl-CoA synthase